jgi:hypothetical protein
MATMLIGRIRYGWQKRRYICVLVGESSGFCRALTNKLPRCGWGGLKISQVMACCFDVLWNLNLRGFS